MARKFLYFIAICVVLVIAALLALRFWARDLTEIAFVPTAEFSPQPPLEANIYSDLSMWISRPGMGAGNPVNWLPQGLPEESGETLHAAVFFIHPTSYLEKAKWNAPLDDAVSRERAALFVQGMASPFNRSADIWAPRYRQAAFGAFLTDAPPSQMALDAAYRDLLEAFEFFLGTVDKSAPIVLAGHSQGAYHLRRLMRDRVAGTPLAGRIAAAYVIGWPVSIDHDLPQMGLPACTTSAQPGCVMSWMSYGEPADNEMLLDGYARWPGLDGQDLAGTPFLCTNPLTGTSGGKAGADDNLGTLVPDVKAKTGRLVPRMVPARCGEDGFLSIGEPPEMGPYVLPGNNYHLYDIPLFWANLRADFARRVTAWQPEP
ncbi:MAG: DUF3089 domain-containing protein [Novosphingobium sp.]|nr:DUF3089 domain-containing protein [Novosphingobium sp.]MCP5404449.1 DUF3089 domain-containing protein [Novosphingobium sp.]